MYHLSSKYKTIMTASFCIIFIGISKTILLSKIGRMDTLEVGKKIENISSCKKELQTHRQFIQ
jgi:hypothetical protein